MTETIANEGDESRLARIVGDLRSRGRAAVRVSYASLLAIAVVVAGGSWAFYGVHGVIEGENQESTARARSAVEGVVRTAYEAGRAIDRAAADFKEGLGARLATMGERDGGTATARRTITELGDTAGTEQLNALVANASAKDDAAAAAAAGAASDLLAAEDQWHRVRNEAYELERNPSGSSPIKEMRDLAIAEQLVATKKANALTAVRLNTSASDNTAALKLIDDLALGRPALRAAVMSRISYSGSRSDLVGALDSLQESAQSRLEAQRALREVRGRVREELSGAEAALREIRRKKNEADAVAAQSAAQRADLSSQVAAHIARAEQRGTDMVRAAQSIASSNASRLSYEKQKVDEMREIVADMPAAPSEGISKTLDELKATLERFPEDVKTVGATQRLVMTLLTRVAIGVLIFFLAQVLLGLYRYNARLAAHYLARADALEILGGKVLGTSKQDRLESLIEKLSADTVDFGRMPRSPTQQVVDLTKAVLQSSSPRRPVVSRTGDADDLG